MSPRPNGRRERLADGIYRDRYGIAARVKVAGFTPEEKRFPLETELEEIIAWRLRRRADLLETDRLDRPERPRRGTLAGDVPTFLATLPAGSRKTDFTLHLAQWIDTPLGTMPRATITHADVLAALATWEDAGLADSTLNHRVRALRELYRALDGRTADGSAYRPNPLDGIKRRPGPRPEARGIPPEFVELILAQLPDRGRPIRGETRGTVSQTKIRLRVEAWTGLPHKQLIALTPADVNLKRALIHVRPRRKGKGAPAVWLGLLPPAIAALADFDKAKLWGQSFSRSSVRKSWHRAITNAGKALAREAAKTKDETRLELFQRVVPANCKPYDLRHSFLTEAYRVSGDLRAVAELGQHSNLNTTRRYTEGAVSERVAAAIAGMAARYAGPTPPPAPPAKSHLALVTRWRRARRAQAQG